MNKILFIVMVLLGGNVFGMENNDDYNPIVRIVPESYHKQKMNDMRKNNKRHAVKRAMLQDVAKNNRKGVQAYLDQGYSIDVQDLYYENANKNNFDQKSQVFKKMTPLMVAAFHGREDMVDFIITENYRSNCSEKLSFPKYMKTLWLNRRNEEEDTALIIASRLGHAGVVQRLLQCNADVTYANKQGKTALQEAQDSLLRKWKSNQFDYIIMMFEQTGVVEQ